MDLLYLLAFLLCAAPGLVAYVVGVYEFKDWLWFLPDKAKERVVSKVREFTALFSGKE